MFATLPIIFKATLEKIEKNSYGIIFLVNNKHELIGVFTDGDARRALLEGNTMNCQITELSTFFNNSPYSLPLGCNISKIFHSSFAKIC